MKELFSELYKTYSLDQLFEVILHPNDYQPAAVEAAKKELQSRNVNEQEINAAISEVNAKKEKKIGKRQIAIRDKFRYYGDKVMAEITISEPITVTQLIRLLSYGLALLWILNIADDMRFMFRMIHYEGFLNQHV